MPRTIPTPSYVVRVYRCEGSDRRQVVGVVEAVGDPVQRAFTHVEELWQILMEGSGPDGSVCPVDSELT